jgi:radical SAM protein with 4Fe4S-binding SPASM domain
MSEAAFDGFPLMVGWELTLACNLRCEHCGSAAGLARHAELTSVEALAVCDQLPDLLVQEVDFTGGEPLLRDDWPVLAKRLVSRGIVVKVLSNGLALDAHTVARLCDAGVAGVGISLDGLAPAHDRLRGCTGLFEETMRSMDRVIRAGLPLTVITTVHGQNVDQLAPLLRLLEDVGAEAWQVQPLFPLGRGRAMELRLTRQSYEGLGAFVFDCRDRPPEELPALLPSDSFGYYTPLDTRDPPWRGCLAGRLACGITSDGMIKGCLSLPDHLAEGDLRQRNLWDIWFDPAAFAYTRVFGPEHLGPNCQGCEMAGQCRGGCSAMSYGSTGRFHNDPYCFCALARQRQRL